MEIIKFDVNSMATNALSDHLSFEEGSIIIKAGNNKAYFNETKVTIVIEKEKGNVRNVKTHINFVSFDEGEVFGTDLDDLNKNSTLTEMCNVYINNASEVKEWEIDQLNQELMEFSNKNLLNYALDTGNKKLFMELTDNMK